MSATTMPNKSSRKQKLEEKAAKNAARTGAWSASNTNIHELYQLSVQNVEAEIDFVDETFEQIRGRKAITLREDFCGTGNTSAEWVRRRSTNTAIGLDLDQPTLDYGIEAHILKLNTDARTESRCSTAMSSPPATRVAQIVYWR